MRKGRGKLQTAMRALWIAEYTTHQPSPWALCCPCQGIHPALPWGMKGGYIHDDQRPSVGDSRRAVLTHDLCRRQEQTCCVADMQHRAQALPMFSSASQFATAGRCKNKTFFPLCLLLLCALCSGTVSNFAHLTPCPSWTWDGWDIHSLDWVSPSAQAGHPQQHQPRSEMGEETHWVLHHPGGAARVALSCDGECGSVRITGGKRHHGWPWWGPGVPACHQQRQRLSWSCRPYSANVSVAQLEKD